MVCKFCGMELKTMGQMLRTSYGTKCRGNGNKNHIAITDGVHCVYCGEETRVMGQVLRTKYSDRCNVSPTKRHALQD